MIDASQIQAFIQEVRYSVNRTYKQVQLIFGRGRSTTAVNDSGVIREVQADLGFNQVIDNLRVVQQYGFASNFPVGTDLILGFVAGDRSNGCVIGTNNQTYQVKDLGNGSVAVYDMFGNIILLSEAGIKCKSPVLVDMEAPKLRLYATEELRYECFGNGTVITPTTRTDYVIGSTGSSTGISPPEIP